jgi:condensin complex subunit 1
VHTEGAAARLKKAKQGPPAAGGAKAEASGQPEDKMETELGLGAEAELEHDTRVGDVVEREVVGGGLLAAFEPLLVRLVANEHGAWGEETLRAAATLALTKYMTVSLEACEKHLPLLFTALAAEVHPSVRGNTVVALGDLAFRFPNAVEPWTSHLYRRLRDASAHVRGQTLMVLTHLILNDMVKVKGQVAEMVLSLEDSEPRTADLAKLFFQELSKRGNNPIYNLMPDIVSRLSQDGQVSREVFRRVMPFLLAFITKDKHSESLVEKLCFRFATCADMAQTQDLAFCLAQLPLNDKGVKKLDSLLKCYRNALFDAEVYKSFEQLIAKAKKFAKPEMKDAVNEFAQKLAACHNGTEGEDDGSRAREAEADGPTAEGAGEVLGEVAEQNEATDEAAEAVVKKTGRAAKGAAKEQAAKDKENAPARSSRGRTSEGAR